MTTMMECQEQTSEDVPLRRRGRPTGRNRIPLSLEERRARNAQYERERRNETTDAMTQLAEAAGCDPHISNADLLVTVISQIRRTTKRKSDESIENLNRINENLESQIAVLEHRLQNEPDCNDQKSIEKHILEQQSETRLNTEPPATDPFCNYKNRNLSKHINKKRKKCKVKKQFRNQIENSELFPDCSSDLNLIASQCELQTETSSTHDVRSHVDPNSNHELQTEIQSLPELYEYNQVKSAPGSTTEEFQSESLIPSVGTQFEPLPITRPQCNNQGDMWTSPGYSHSEQLSNTYEESQPTMDLLTDREKTIIAECIDCDNVLDIVAQRNEPQVRSWPYEQFLPKFS